MAVTVVHGDCRAVMASMEANQFDAVVCDPPYDLLSVSRGGSGRTNGGAGPYQRHQGAGGFMGMQWDGTGVAFDPATWAAAMRVMRPGGYLLAFSGTRTQHRMVCAIEDAGFEIRDSIAWITGQGFPKSLNVSADLRRRVPLDAQCVCAPHSTQTVADSLDGYPDHHGSDDAPPRQAQVYPNLPRCEACEKVMIPDGWGTALKPAIEFVCVARKPLSEGTVAANVLRWGTGGINIDGCRIEADARPLLEVHALRDDVDYQPNSLAGRVDGSLQSSKAIGTTDLGRWPANVVLSHAADCEPVGTRRVKGSRIDKPSDPTPNSGYQGRLGGARPARGIGDADGLESVEAWDCTPDCPVRLLDEQSGRLTSGTGAVKRATAAGWQGNALGTESRAPGTPNIEYGDTGGASRFFYTSKASRAERNEGVRQVGGTNSHPTVKPVDLMRWLCRLVTRPGGHILDPFVGSGTTLVAALLEGFDATGIDQSAEYVELARKRIDGIQIGGMW